MTDQFRCEADRVAAERKKEQRAEFMRVYVLNVVRRGSRLAAEKDDTFGYLAQEARAAWDAIEREAAR